MLRRLTLSTPWRDQAALITTPVISTSQYFRRRSTQARSLPNLRWTRSIFTNPSATTRLAYGDGASSAPIEAARSRSRPASQVPKSLLRNGSNSPNGVAAEPWPLRGGSRAAPLLQFQRITFDSKEL